MAFTFRSYFTSLVNKLVHARRNIHYQPLVFSNSVHWHIWSHMIITSKDVMKILAYFGIALSAYSFKLGNHTCSHSSRSLFCHSRSRFSYDLEINSNWACFGERKWHRYAHWPKLEQTTLEQTCTKSNWLHCEACAFVHVWNRSTIEKYWFSQHSNLHYTHDPLTGIS